MKALILLCSFLITLSQYAFAQQDLVYGGDIQDIEVVGKQKYDRLTSRGARIPNAVVSFDDKSKHKYLGSLVECPIQFEISKFSLTVQHCLAERAIFKLTFRKIEADGTHREMLEKPLLFSMSRSSEKAEYYVSPEENITIAPGTYYIGIALLEIVGEEAEVNFPLYIKKSYVIPAESTELQPVIYNIGLAVAGRKIK
ncbi:MAG: hypothetical protein IKV77_06910 [Alistipes sp.]|nr:hypothetical protein [Alistipes sp.]